MKLSELYAKLKTAGDVHAYTLYLAAPDDDKVDVDLAAVGRVEVRSEAGEVRIYPASTSTDVDSIEPEPYLGMLLAELPKEVREDSDLRLMVEVPLLREESGHEDVSFEEVRDLYIGVDSEEAWLLLTDTSEFAVGLLPT